MREKAEKIPDGIQTIITQVIVNVATESEFKTLYDFLVAFPQPRIFIRYLLDLKLLIFSEQFKDLLLHLETQQKMYQELLALANKKIKIVYFFWQSCSLRKTLLKILKVSSTLEKPLTNEGLKALILELYAY